MAELMKSIPTRAFAALGTSEIASAAELVRVRDFWRNFPSNNPYANLSSGVLHSKAALSMEIGDRLAAPLEPRSTPPRAVAPVEYKKVLRSTFPLRHERTL